MAEESDDGFNPSQIVKKADLGGLGVDTDTEDVLKEFNFLTQPEVSAAGGCDRVLSLLLLARCSGQGCRVEWWWGVGCSTGWRSCRTRTRNSWSTGCGPEQLRAWGAGAAHHQQ